MNNTMKQRGFSLVEVVVVSVIVAILAAVAIPMYIGFQQDARVQAVSQLASTAAAAADGFYRKTGADPAVDDLNLYYDAEKFVVEVSGGSVSVQMIGNDDCSRSISYR